MSYRRRGSFVASKDFDTSEFLPDGGYSASRRNQWYFEIAWEVANKGTDDLSNYYGTFKNC